MLPLLQHAVAAVALVRPLHAARPVGGGEARHHRLHGAGGEHLVVVLPPVVGILGHEEPGQPWTFPSLHDVWVVLVLVQVPPRPAVRGGIHRGAVRALLGVVLGTGGDGLAIPHQPPNQP